jgi:hypothetical protein
MSIWSAPQPDPNYDANQKARTEVFNKIANRENWKAGINAWIREADFDECKEAAVFFTGGPIEIVQRVGGSVRVVGLGYYHHIGA